MSPWLRWGVIGSRELARRALAADSQKYLEELLWREFFMDGFFRYPESAREEWRPETRSADWSREERAFALWREGKTGYPLVDAAMRELVATGRMHNRFRMLAANFLCKILRIDWRWGERHFAKQLRDYEPALNVGNWQWSAGTGVDAAPYFRVFNPTLQAGKHDPSGTYVRQWIPEIGTPAYPDPIVDFSEARKKYLSWWKNLVAKSGG